MLAFMRVLIAPQAFKGSLPAAKVAAAIVRGLPAGCEPDLLPMADGGEGTVDALLAAIGGRRQTSVVRDPLGGPVQARWARLKDGRAAIEMAAANGLTLLRESQRDPRKGTTYGTGQLIGEALATKVKEVVVGIGGSGTNDGGAFALAALGARLLDARKNDLPQDVLHLRRLRTLDLSGLPWQLRDVHLRVMCDVTNPLLGPNGATAVYGPQKGVTKALQPRLEAALEHWADVVEGEIQNSKFTIQSPHPGPLRVGDGARRLRDMPGAGAAGGLGFALLAVGGTLELGAELVLDLARFDERVKRASLVITGEGRLDGQSLAGKATVTVARRAKKAGVPVLAIVGGLGGGYEAAYAEGISAVQPITTGAMSLEEAQKHAGELITAATERAFRMITIDLAPEKTHAARH